MLDTARDYVGPLLGRVEEQELLASLLDGVTERGRALVLRGEPGIGKSRLPASRATNLRRTHSGGWALRTSRPPHGSSRFPIRGVRPMSGVSDGRS
jgi:hypothetical protein